ncbi:MAG: hypothetical protein R3332_09000 [Pseudohongiellaceae bacterium]|nr:hypothetical protein [Pseudohongiellaceae bacterium]
MKTDFSRLLFTFVIVAATAAAQAQDLTLFEEVQTDSSTSAAANDDAGPRRNGVSGPAYTLVGTSRIGGKHTALLRGSDGEVQRVEFRAGAGVAVPGSGGFTVVDIQSRQVRLRHPASQPCVSDMDQGVSCVDGMSILSMATAEPIIRRTEQAPEPETAEQPADADVPPDNPFAAALRAAAENADSQEVRDTAQRRRERFAPRRIAPEDVPEGMRLVRTPFGDRLVER